MKTREEIMQENNDKQRRVLQDIMSEISRMEKEEAQGLLLLSNPKIRAYRAAWDSVHALFEDLSKCDENGMYTKTL